MIPKITLLLFSVEYLFFGVCAEQVEEVLKIPSRTVIKPAEDIKTVTYKGQELQIIDFSQQLGLDKISPGYQKTLKPLKPPSRILIAKHRSEEHVAVYIDLLQKLLTISVDQIHPLPPLMEKSRRVQAIWGIALVENRPIILLDLEQL